MKINPDSTILQQLDEHWQKMAMLILWKLAKRTQIKITVEDMKACAKEFGEVGAIIYTHGHSDSIEFQLVDEAQALALAAHDKTMKGTA